VEFYPIQIIDVSRRNKAYETAWWVINVILSCQTCDQLKTMKNLVHNYELMFPDWFWVYEEEFVDAMNEVNEDLKCYTIAENITN
jgi:glycerol-3-phosphate cytidylyltransferase-like family protein